MDYDNTPSFYNNNEYFERYLGRTSYYLGLQKAVDKIIAAVGPEKVLELGTALGTTLLMLADKYSDILFEGVDMRGEVVLQAEKKSRKNSRFTVADMCKYVEASLKDYDMIYMLYSFHHIPDPLGKKIDFLRNCFLNMKEGAYLLIAESFLPESVEELQGKEILHLFNQRALEGYASTFWESFSSLSTMDLDLSRKIAQFSANEENEAGKLVYKRQDEYLVKFEWLRQTSKDIGFKVILAEPVNSIMEKVILLQKGGL